jgi:TRAP-type mannitol/chloroaromatic compound transport system substrate-binding protein
MSENTFIINIFSSNEIVGGAKIFDAVKNGQIEMGNGWPNWWSSHHPTWAVMNAGPYDFMNIDASMMFFLAGKGTEMANILASKKGVVWRPAWWAGMEFGLISKKPIYSIKDLKGKKVRIGPGMPSEFLAEATGSYSIPLIPSEIREALNSDQLDAVEWTTANGVLELGLTDIAKHAIVPAVWQPSVLSDFLMNDKAYNLLSKQHRRILEVAIKAFTLTTTTKAKKLDIESIDKLKRSGVVISQWPKSDYAIWKNNSNKINKRYKSKDKFSSDLLNAKESFKKQYNRYYKYFGPYDE